MNIFAAYFLKLIQIMKQRFLKLAISIVLLQFSVLISKAQNIQLHYDFGRQCATSTIEMFKPDRAGSTFFFVDMDYKPKVTGAYFEIAREFCFWQNSKADWLSIHIEYNGGLDIQAKSYNNAILPGLTYSGHSKDYRKTWSLSAMYKAIPGTVDANGNKQVHNFQITGVWTINFAYDWLTFSGFADFWRECRPWQGTEYIFVSEPQLWLNFKKIPKWDDVNLSLGTEVELSANFAGKGFACYPTIALKYQF